MVVISKNLPKDPEFIRVLNSLKSRCKVLLIRPFDEATSERVFQTANSISEYAIVDEGTSQGDVSPMKMDFSSKISLSKSSYCLFRFHLMYL